MFTCNICQKNFQYKKGLSKHLSYTHKIDLREYYDLYFRKEKENICPVCKKETFFRSFRDGYAKLCKQCINKSKFPSNIEYWIYHNYDLENAKKEVEKFQRNQSKKVKNRQYNTTIEYWLKHGYSNEEAEQKLKERQAVGSLKNFQKRFGNIEGKEKWQARQDKWQKTMNSKSSKEKERINKLKGITLENMIRKWGEIDGAEKYEQWKLSFKNRFHLNFSNISQELFFEILNHIKDKENVKFGKHNKEFFIFYESKFYCFDFKYLNKIIEFNGDLFHANPSIFNENDCPNPYNKMLSSKTIWELDNKKLNILTKLNYEYLIIWENDYKKDKNKELQKCLNFLNL